MTLKQTTVLAACLFAVGGCSYRQINPESAQKIEREQNGHDELSEVEPGTAKLVVRSMGNRFPVHFSVAQASQSCPRYEPLGNVAYFGQGEVYPWISRATRFGSGSAETYIAHEVGQPGVPLQVRAVGSWANTTPGYNGQQSGKCGPLEARFTPEAGHAYTAEFVWTAVSQCHLEVMEATQPDAPKPVTKQVLLACDKAASQ